MSTSNITVPDEADVRAGVVYGEDNSRVGTARVIDPMAPADTLLGELGQVALEVMFDTNCAATAATLIVRRSSNRAEDLTFSIAIVEDDHESQRQRTQSTATRNERVVAWIPLEDIAGDPVPTPDDRCWLQVGSADPLAFADMLESNEAGHLCVFGQKQLRAVGPMNSARAV